MEKVYTFATEEKEFLFVLNQPIMTEQEDDRGFPFVACKIYRKDQPNQVWTWQGHLQPTLKQQVELIYPDNINFKGEFFLYQDGNSNQNFVFMDARYGEQYNNHFEGNIFVIDG